jgi:hypothetical protein
LKTGKFTKIGLQAGVFHDREKRFVEKNTILVREFDRYIQEYPKFADKIPNNALIVMQIEKSFLDTFRTSSENRGHREKND